jgi:hypothetical protein
MKTIKLIIIGCSILLLTNCGDNSPLSRPKTPEELRIELKQKEEVEPLTYLSCEGVIMTKQQKKIRNGGLFRDPEYAPDGAIFEGNFINKASIAKFKDIQVKISFYSKTQTLIKEDTYIIYEYYPANTTKLFSFKIAEIPEAQESFEFAVVGATATD